MAISILKFILTNLRKENTKISFAVSNTHAQSLEFWVLFKLWALSICYHIEFYSLKNVKFCCCLYKYTLNLKPFTKWKAPPKQKKSLELIYVKRISLIAKLL